MQTGIALVESSMEFLHKIKSVTALWPSDSTPGDVCEETQNSDLKEISTPMFIAALFTIAKVWKQPKHPAVGE